MLSRPLGLLSESPKLKKERHSTAMAMDDALFAYKLCRLFYFFGSWNELFSETTRLNTGRPGTEYFGSTLK